MHGVQTRPVRWWIPLVAAVGAALLAGLVACAIFTVWRRRRRRNKRELGPGQVRGPQLCKSCSSKCAAYIDFETDS